MTCAPKVCSRTNLAPKQHLQCTASKPGTKAASAMHCSKKPEIDNDVPAQGGASVHKFLAQRSPISWRTPRPAGCQAALRRLACSCIGWCRCCSGSLALAPKPAACKTASNSQVTTSQPTANQPRDQPTNIQPTNKPAPCQTASQPTSLAATCTKERMRQATGTHSVSQIPGNMPAIGSSGVVGIRQSASEPRAWLPGLNPYHLAFRVCPHCWPELRQLSPATALRAFFCHGFA